LRHLQIIWRRREIMPKKTAEKKAKGKSAPAKGASREWITYSPKEIEDLIVKLAKEGNTQSKIGIILRDQYGIPDVAELLNKKMGKVIEEKGLKGEIPEDLMNLIKRAVSLDKHLAENRKDFHSKRGMELTESKINRLARYYKKAGTLPQDWKYNLEQAKLLVR